MPYPLKFYEIYKPKIWGGRSIERVLGKRLPPDEKIGESWELSDHFDDVSVVRNGPLEGSRLRDLWKGAPGEILGKAISGRKFKEFPLLVKFIDASEALSVQVHPDDEYAKAHDPSGESGKNESWYVVAAAPGAQLVAGVKEGTTRRDFQRLVKEGRVEECLNRVSVEAGDVIGIAAGTVHAVGPGIVLCEIQQTSDATYRIWDWGRVDSEGKARPLHLEHAMNVIDFKRGPVGPVTPEEASSQEGRRRQVLERRGEFVIEKVDCSQTLVECPTGDRFYILICISGSGSILAEGERHPYASGDTVLAPASMEALTIEPAGESSFLKTWIP